jgi:hypothetical protein
VLSSRPITTSNIALSLVGLAGYGRRILDAEARDQYPGSSSGVCGAESGNKNRFSLIISNAVAQLVETLRSKPEGRGFDSRWSHWNFSAT